MDGPPWPSRTRWDPMGPDGMPWDGCHSPHNPATPQTFRRERQQVNTVLLVAGFGTKKGLLDAVGIEPSTVMTCPHADH
jgi:hypothetical protein